jgi:small subunit ribosomal protein S20
MEEARCRRTGGRGHEDAAAHHHRRRRSTGMANIKSQVKRIKTNEKARQRNQSVRSSVKTAVRKFRDAADAGDKDKALELQREASKKLDKAATKGVLHPNQAANKKSAMAKRVNKL